MESPRADTVNGPSTYELKTFKMPLNTTQLHALCVPALLKLTPDQIQTHPQKTGGVQKA